MKIIQKLSSAFATIIIFVIILILVGFKSLTNVNDTTQTITNGRIPKIIELNIILSAIGDQSRALRELMLTDDMDLRNEMYETIKSRTAIISANYDSLSKTINSADGKVIMNKLQNSRNNFISDVYT